MTIRPVEDRRLTAIACVACAYAFFTCIDSCAKWLVLAGLPPMEVVFVRYAVHAAIVLLLFLPQRGPSLFHTRRPGLEFLRGAALLTSTILNFLAVQYLPLTLTAAVLFTLPLWVCALSIPLLGERVGPRRWTAIFIGFAGVLIATQPWTADVHWAVVLSIGTAISAAFYAILTRKLAGIDATATQQFYAAGLATIGVAPFAFFDWLWPVTTVDWVAFVLIGIFGWSGHQLLTVAHRFAAASALAPFAYVQLIYMTTSSWLIFSQPPGPSIVAGSLVIVASGLYVWLRERQLDRG